MTTYEENAEPFIRRHMLQWQLTMRRASASAARRTAPQRHEPTSPVIALTRHASNDAAAQPQASRKSETDWFRSLITAMGLADPIARSHFNTGYTAAISWKFRCFVPAMVVLVISAPPDTAREASLLPAFSSL